VTSVCDGFCGVGGNAIAFARQGLHVIAIELDKTRLECAKNNARVYAVEHLITFIHGDFMTLKNIKADSVFLSPPW
jgi:trimethylguanosine synthase